VDDAVEDGVGQGRVADQVAPAVDRDLASQQRGAAAVAIFDDLQHVVALLGPEGFEAPIVEDQQLEDQTQRRNDATSKRAPDHQRGNRPSAAASVVNRTD